MILADSLPAFKLFLRQARLPAHWLAHVTAFVAAFLLHQGPMSSSQAASFFRHRRRHVATLTRFLAQLGHSRDLLGCVRSATLLLERHLRQPGQWVFVLDSSLRHSQGLLENSFQSGNKKPRPKNSSRKQLKYHRRHSHLFVFGLLLSPAGLRLPYWLPYYTQEYAQRIDRPFHTQAELAAQRVAGLDVPASAEVVVVGDTAFEAECVRQACQARGFWWVAPANPERVLAGRKPRRRLRALTEEMTERSFEPYRLPRDRGPHRQQKRCSAGRSGLGRPTSRTYWVHRRIAEVHSVGEVVLLFSKKDRPKAGAAIAVDKLLLSNALGAATGQLLGWYDLRWQVELFFKECKSELGLARYRLGKFVQVEGWVELCLVAFCYLEWYRARRLASAELAPRQRQDWQRARTGRLRRLIGQRLEEEEVERLYRWGRSRGGLRKLKRLLRDAHGSLRPKREAG